MEKDVIKSALEIALELKNELLLLIERSQDHIRQLDLLLQLGEPNSTPKEKSMPECLKELPRTFRYLSRDLYELLSKARKAGVLDEELQPLCTWSEASVLANLICDQLNVIKKWRLFSYIWDFGNYKLCSYYQRALNSTNFVDIEQRMLKILSNSK